jgi:hypothetical protein
MGGPVELEASLGARDISSVQVLVNIFGNFIIWELDEAIANRSVFHFVSDQLDRGNTCDLNKDK